MSDSSKKPLFMPGSTQPKSGKPLDNRETIRFPFTASAQVIDRRSSVRIVGRTADIGPGGCYIDTISPFPVGTVASVRVEHGGRTFEAIATVTYSHISMGMGLAFKEINPEHRTVLNYWIAELTGEPLPETLKDASVTAVAAVTDETPAGASVVTLRHALNELINLLVSKKVVTETEAAALLHRMFLKP
jgi:hypothetical protein